MSLLQLGDRYGYELFYDNVSQGEVDICNGCNSYLSGSISITIPNSVNTVSVIIYGQFDGESDIVAIDNIKLSF